MTQPGEGVVGVGSNSKARHDVSKLDRNKLDGNKIDSDEVKVDEVGKKVQKTTKFKNSYKSKKAVGPSDFFTSGAKLAFTELRQAFFKAPIFYHFDPKHHIQIETNESNYAISGVLCLLTSNHSGQWHPVAFLSRKMIAAETRYKTHNGKLLAIVEAFMIWKHYLQGSWHKVLMLSNYNNL